MTDVMNTHAWKAVLAQPDRTMVRAVDRQTTVPRRPPIGPRTGNDIPDWNDDWNDDPKPFAWTKTADDILERLASYLHRIPGAGHQ